MNAILPTSPNQAQIQEATTPESLRAMSLRLLAQAKGLKHDLALISEQKKSIIDGNESVRKATVAAEPYTKVLTSARKAVREQPEHKGLVAKEKEVKKELKEVSTSLTNHLVNFTRLTGVNVIEDENGKELKIKHAISVLSGQMRLF